MLRSRNREAQFHRTEVDIGFARHSCESIGPVEPRGQTALGSFTIGLVSGVPAQNLQVIKETFMADSRSLADSIQPQQAKSRRELLVFDSVLNIWQLCHDRS